MTESQILESLVQALESQLDSVTYYYDRDAGQVVVINDELGEAPADFEHESGRFLFIAPLSSNERYKIMEDFIEIQENESLQEELTQALIGRGAFTQFEKALEKYPTRREQWKKFREERARVRAQAWLWENGVFS